MWSTENTGNHIQRGILESEPIIDVVQSLSHVQLFTTPWTTARQASPSFSISQSLLKFMSIESVMPSNSLILCRPLLPPSIFPSVRVFSSEYLGLNFLCVLEGVRNINSLNFYNKSMGFSVLFPLQLGHRRSPER